MFGDFTGLGYGVSTALAVELSARLIAQNTPATGVRWAKRGLPAGALTGFLTWIFVAFSDAGASAPVIGLAVGCVGALVLGLDAPSRITPVQSPSQSLARDRTAFIFRVVGTSLVSALTLALLDSSLRRAQAPIGIVGALAYGAGLGVIIAAGKSCWARYSLARLLLVLTGRLPW